MYERGTQPVLGRITPPPPLHSNRPCIVSGEGGDEGTVTFRLANLLRRSDIELLLCVCWLDKVVLLVHCCVLQISGIQGTPQACFQSCQTSCETLSQECSQTCAQGGSQACSPACSWRAHSCGPRGAYAALQSQIPPPEKVAHRACFSVELNEHPNKQFTAHFVVHTPLFRTSCFVSRVLCLAMRGARELSRTTAYYTGGGDN